MFSENLVIMRKKKELSQEKLAEILGVSRQTLSKWESGESLPDLMKGMEIADFFGTTLDELIQHNVSESGVSVAPKGKHIFGVVKMSERGQIVIPSRARAVFHLSPGERLILVGDEDRGLALLPEQCLLGFLEKLKSMEEEV